MLCSNCGTALNIDVNFCHKCGTSIENKGEVSNETTYEICEIQVHLAGSRSITQMFNLKQSNWVWIATAISPQGKRKVASSSEFTSRGERIPDDNYRVPRDELIAKLLKDGWEPIDTKYYGQTFKRQFKR
jgi:hypothetical protein